MDSRRRALIMKTPMEPDSAIDTRLRQYLLGQLDEDARTTLERQYVTDERVFEQLLVAEDELIDAYVGEALSQDERVRFERAFLTTPARRERVAVARGLDELASRQTVPGPIHPPAPGLRTLAAAWLRGVSPAQWSTAGLAATLLLGSSWLLVDRARLQNTVEAVRAELTQRTVELQREVDAERRRAEALATARDRVGSTTGPWPAIASFVLTPRLTRAGEANALRLEATTALVRLQLSLEADLHPRYRPVLTTVAGEVVWNQQAVPPRATSDGPVVVIDLPATLLANRDYVLTLSGERPGAAPEEVAAYTFRIARP
jgi:hypothetical protein